MMLLQQRQLLQTIAYHQNKITTLHINSKIVAVKFRLFQKQEELRIKIISWWSVVEAPLLTPHNYMGTVVHSAHARPNTTESLSFGSIVATATQPVSQLGNNYTAPLADLVNYISKKTSAVCYYPKIRVL